MKYKFKRWIIFFITILICIGIIEFFLRVYGSNFSENIYMYHPKRFYSLKPNITFKSPNGVSNFLNNYGLPDKNISLKKPRNEKRILILGDSFSQNINVPYIERFPKILENKMNKNNRYNNNFYRVINAGITGYNTFQERVLLEEIGLKYKPDLVILCYLLNDAFPPSTLKKFYYDLPEFWSKKIFYLLNELYFLRYIRLYLHRILSENYFEKLGTVSEFTRTKSFKNSYKELINIKTICSNHKIKFVVVILPYLHTLNRFKPYYNMLEKKLKKNDFKVYNIYKNISGYKNNWSDLWVDKYNSHPNEKTNNIFASAIFKIINNNHLKFK